MPAPRILISRFLILAGLVLCGNILRATTLYSNFGAGEGYYAGGGVVVANGVVDYSIAVELPTMTANYDLSSIEFVASTQNPDPSNSVSVSIYTDNGGVPGTDLETITLNGQLAPFDGSLSPVLTATSSLQPELFAGSNYWLVMDAPSSESVIWDYNSTLTSGYLETTGVAGDWVNNPNPYSDNTNGVFEVDATLASSTPEPKTWMLMAGGLCALVWFSRRGVESRTQRYR